MKCSAGVALAPDSQNISSTLKRDSDTVRRSKWFPFCARRNTEQKVCTFSTPLSRRKTKRKTKRKRARDGVLSVSSGGGDDDDDAKVAFAFFSFSEDEEEGLERREHREHREEEEEEEESRDCAIIIDT